MKINQKIATILNEISELLDIAGVNFKPRAYSKSAGIIKNLNENIAEIYQTQGIKGLQNIQSVGKSISQKIEEYLQTGKIKYLQELRKKNRIREIIAYYFQTKSISLLQLKKDSRKQKIIYSRFTKPAKQLLELTGSVKKAKNALDIISALARSRNLDYGIETVFKKWLELDQLKPKEIKKKPFFRGDLMVWSEMKKKWYVIDKYGTWLEFAGKISEIEWKEDTK